MLQDILLINEPKKNQPASSASLVTNSHFHDNAHWCVAVKLKLNWAADHLSQSLSNPSAGSSDRLDIISAASSSKH